MAEAALILKDRVLLREGRANGLFYSYDDLVPLATELNKEPPKDSPEEANRDSLFLDHGDGALTWVGTVVNFRVDPKTKTLRGDLQIVDQDIADKIQYQIDDGRSRFGISPRLLVKAEDGKAKDIRMRSFSLVLNPAGGEELMLWAHGEVLKVDKSQRLVLGPVLIPEKIDLQGEIISAHEIEKTAHGFLKAALTGKARPGEMHTEFDKKLDVVESYIMPCDGMINNQMVKKGTWMLCVHVNDDAAWAKVLKGHYKGFSVGGFARKIPVG